MKWQLRVDCFLLLDYYSIKRMQTIEYANKERKRERERERERDRGRIKNILANHIYAAHKCGSRGGAITLQMCIYRKVSYFAKKNDYSIYFLRFK